MKSIKIKLPKHGLFILCIRTNNDYWCEDIEALSKVNNDIVTYKPLFIVIMYSLCALILVPIALWSKYTKRANFSKKSHLIRILNKHREKDSLKKQSIKQLYSCETLLESNKYQNEEANHILDSKPWLNEDITSPLKDKNSLKNNLSELFKQDAQYALEDLEEYENNNDELKTVKQDNKFFLTNSLSSLNKNVASKLYSNRQIYSYESNV